jgi:hypothetical protein
MMKTDAAITPFPEFGKDIVGKKSDAGGSPDQFLFGRIRLWRGKHKHRRPVYGRHRKPTVAGFRESVKGKSKAKLIQIKLQASLLVPDEDGYGAETKIGILAIWMKTAPVRLKGLQSGAHVLEL